MRKLVKWSSFVEKVFKEGELWKSNEDATQKLFFDRVLVCTGKLWDPNYPSFVLKNLSQTKIDCCHSRYYRNLCVIMAKELLLLVQETPL